MPHIDTQLARVVTKSYLSYMNQFPVHEDTTPLEEVQKCSRLDKISKIVYDREEDNQGKLSSVFSAMSRRGSTLVMVIRGHENHADIYLGTRSQSGREDAATAMTTLESSLKGSFPGIDLHEVSARELPSICDALSSTENRYVSAVAGVPSLKENQEDVFIQGLEKVIDGLQGKTYTAIMVATPVSREELDTAETAYHDLHTALSLISQQQITLSENQSRAVGKSVSKTYTETLSDNLSRTQNTSAGKTRNLGGTVAGAGAAIGAGIGLALGGAGVLPGAMIGGGIGGALGGLLGSNTKTKSQGTSRSTGESRSDALMEGANETDTTSKGRSYQYTIENRQAKQYMEIIDEQLKRIQACRNHGMWDLGTYFVAAESVPVRVGSNILAGVLCGESTGLERSAIVEWRRAESGDKYFDTLTDHLAKFAHPVFDVSEALPFSTAMMCSLVSTPELTVGMGLPQKSLPGIPVLDSVEFGRTVTMHRGRNEGDGIRIGSISHMGEYEAGQEVSLQVDSLASHVFITGSTGAGKSNGIYLALDRLWKRKRRVPFLVIESAKGEYKTVFGGLSGVRVLGTNPALTDVLRLNPFSFPEEIHVVEHCDRLIEILNAAWPMYAAMPAILKEAVERTYENFGWDLVSSQNRYGKGAFPCFEDLQKVLPDVIEQSAYSAEVKGNYVGSLVKRINSLTNGYYRTILQKQELSCEELFEQRCIIDLSRVASTETTSLLMGFVFMKLHEYRLAGPSEANTGLRHVTVLEEAHNLLRRTSSEQGQETANLQGKSVEMLSNAIAEMRTYGEGFIIADQAPGLLDPSAIRNTNTKIILRLPDYEDRTLVGRAANLDDEQIKELARLPTGCAAVYQNNWQEAVLCQLDRFKNDEPPAWSYTPPAESITVPQGKTKGLLLAYLLQLKLADGDITTETPDNWQVFISFYPKLCHDLKHGSCGVLEAIDQLIELPTLTKSIPATSDRTAWTKTLCAETIKFLEDENRDLRAELIRSVFQLLQAKRAGGYDWINEIDAAAKMGEELW